MEFDDDKVDLSQLDDRRGQSGASGGGAFGGMPSSGGGPFGGGQGSTDIGNVLATGCAVKSLGSMGAIGILLLIGFLLLSQCAGQNTASQGTLGPSVSGNSAQVVGGDPQNMATRCTTAAAIQQYDDCFILKSFNSINKVWATALPQQAGKTYRNPKLVYFTRAVRTGCGTAQSSTGPFYCPPDQTVYIDLDYMNTLFKQIGASGRYAQTYVVAHEVGHHLQTLLGTEAQVRQAQQRNPRQANALSVKMELQADCYAGVYGRLANDNGTQKITQAEYAQAIQAAGAVGDDKIMANAGMRVNPDKFTHGTAAQRQQWFETGFNSGSIRSCNTFA